MRKKEEFMQKLVFGFTFISKKTESIDMKRKTQMKKSVFFKTAYTYGECVVKTQRTLWN